MKNLTLSIDEKVLEQARKYAAEHSTTVNQMVRDFISSTVLNNGEQRIRKLRKSFAMTDAAGAKSGGWKFNREEIYAERMGKICKRK